MATFPADLNCPEHGETCPPRASCGWRTTGRHTHIIPVDPSLTPEEAWREICIMGFRSTDTGEPSWVTVNCDGDECRSINDV